MLEATFAIFMLFYLRNNYQWCQQSTSRPAVLLPRCFDFGIYVVLHISNINKRLFFVLSLILPPRVNAFTSSFNAVGHSINSPLSYYTILNWMRRSNCCFNFSLMEMHHISESFAAHLLAIPTLLMAIELSLMDRKPVHAEVTAAQVQGKLCPQGRAGPGKLPEPHWAFEKLTHFSSARACTSNPAGPWFQNGWSCWFTDLELVKESAAGLLGVLQRTLWPIA